MSQTAQAVENALKGEKTFQTVQFAITGDAETDMIAGMMAVADAAMNTSGIQTAGQWPSEFSRMAQRVCSYLSGRYEAYARMKEKQEDSFKQMSQASMGSWKEIAPPPGQPYSSGGLAGQIYGSSSALANIHPQMSQNQMTAEEIRRRQRQCDISQVLKEMEEKQP